MIMRNPLETEAHWTKRAVRPCPNPPTPNLREQVLAEADVLVNGDRNNTYGDPRQDFARTAAMWTAYLGIEIADHDVAALMSLLKLSRIRWSPTKRDHWVDLAGYAACGGECALWHNEVGSNEVREEAS